MFRSVTKHHRATNTKYQSEETYSIQVYSLGLWDPMSSQQLLQYKLYKIVKMSKLVCGC